MAWTWRLETSDGAPVRGVASPQHGSQADAESWLGEHWRGFADDGVAQVTLLDSGTEVYGPMPLSSE